jgi:hypothetical protein
MDGGAIPTASVADPGYFIPETNFVHPRSLNQQQKEKENYSCINFVVAIKNKII